MQTRCKVVSLTVAAYLIIVSITLSQNIVSRPVGYLRIEIPPREQVLISTPFYAFDDSINYIFEGQLTGALDLEEADRIFKWNTELMKYETAVKLGEMWVKDGGDEDDVSGMTFFPGEGFIIQNRQAETQTVYLSGEIVLDKSIDLTITPGLNLLSYPYTKPKDVSGIHLTREDGTVSTNHLNMDEVWFNNQTAWLPLDGNDAGVMVKLGEGLWYARKAEEILIWSEVRPYTDLFPEDITTPRILDMSIKNGDVELVIQTDGVEGEVLEVYRQDLSAETGFESERSWELAASGIVTGGKKVLIWKDVSASDNNGFRARSYLVGRSDIDTDGDGVPDSREVFIDHTNPLSSQVSPAMPGTENTFTADTNTTQDAEAMTNGVAFLNVIPSKRIYAKVVYVDRKIGRNTLGGRSPVIVDSDGPKRTIKAGLAEAKAGDTLVIKEGRYGEDLDLRGRNIKVRIQGKVSLRGSAVLSDPENEQPDLPLLSLGVSNIDTNGLNRTE